jgi:drug/metabolite transporter (DMT)-like permease
VDPAALPYILVTGFFFGSSLIATRFGLAQFDAASYTGLRLLFASAGFLAIYTLDRRRHPWPPDRRIWRHSLILSIVGIIIPFFGSILKLQYLSSGVVAMFITVGPAMTVLLAHFLLDGESLTSSKSMGVVLALSGALLLAIRGETGLVEVDSGGPIGYLFMTATLLGVSLSTIYMRKYMGGFDSFEVSSSQMLVATVISLPLIAVIAGISVAGVDWRGFSVLLYSAIIGALLGVIAYNLSIQRFGATTAAMTQYVVPVVAGIGGVLLLGERITLIMLIGIALIVGGITIIRR